MRYLALTLSFLLALTLQLNDARAQNRNVIDAVGRDVTIPIAPKRVVALHEPLIALALMELGMNVVGSYGRTDSGDTLMSVDFIKTVLGRNAADMGITGIGAIGNIDLERLRALKPDLIVGTEVDALKADQLSTIAPVYLQTTRAGKATGFSAAGEMAAAFGREDAFNRLKADYLRSVETTRPILSGKAGERTYLVVIIFDQINVLHDITGVTQALRDLGYRQATWDGSGKAVGYGQGVGIPISPEAFARLDPDLLVIMNSYASPDHNETAIRARLDQIVPGWARFLTPEKEGRVLYLNATKMATPTVSSAHHSVRAIADWAKSQQKP